VDLMKVFRSPAPIPAFLKRRRQTSRVRNILDHCRPIESNEEKKLFLTLLPQHTKGTKIDWTGLTASYNVTVSEEWAKERHRSDLYLKEPRHPQAYAKELVQMAATHETERLTAAIQGRLPGPANLPAQQGNLPAHQGVQAAPPALPDLALFAEADKGGHSNGRGGRGGSRYCEPCEGKIAQRYRQAVRVPLLGHGGACVAAMSMLVSLPRRLGGSHTVPARWRRRVRHLSQ
jgi:hypothetical protein